MNLSFETDATPQTLPMGSFGSVRVFLLRHARVWMSGLLILSDLVSLTIAGMLAVALRGLLGDFDTNYYPRYIALEALFVGIYALRHLYPAIGMGAVEEYRRLTMGTSFGFVAVAAYTFLEHLPSVFSRLVFGISWLLALALVPLGRAATRAIFTRLHLWGEPVAISGAPETTHEIAHALEQYPKIGLIPAMVCRQGACMAILGSAAFDLPDQGRTERCRQCPVALARVAMVVYSSYDELDEIRRQYRDTFERVIMVNHRDRGLGLSSMAVREFGGLTGMEIRQNLLDRKAQLEKRILDVVGSGIGLLLLSPLFLVTAGLIYLDDPGRIFYRQLRVGKNGQYFNLLKFRTMHLNADHVLQTYLAADPALKAEWEQYQKLKHDPRITRVGGFLRRFSIDELPQLWNVFIGDMSLTGPRPIMVNQVEMYGLPYEHYVRVTPGMTGLWQISGRNKTTFARRAALDVHYVMSWSIWLDIYIMARTVWVVLRRDGAE